jgi:hypothetical protein
MEIAKCSDNSQTTVQDCNHGYSAFSFSAWVLLKSICNQIPKMTLPSNYFLLEPAF